MVLCSSDHAVAVPLFRGTRRRCPNLPQTPRMPHWPGLAALPHQAPLDRAQRRLRVSASSFAVAMASVGERASANRDVGNENGVRCDMKWTSPQPQLQGQSRQQTAGHRLGSPLMPRFGCCCNPSYGRRRCQVHPHRPLTTLSVQKAYNGPFEPRKNRPGHGTASWMPESVSACMSCRHRHRAVVRGLIEPGVVRAELSVGSLITFAFGMLRSLPSSPFAAAHPADEAPSHPLLPGLGW